MAINVKFLKGTKTQYNAIATKDPNTFYYTSDDSKLFLGSIELSTPDDITAAKNLVNDTTKGNNALYTAIQELSGDGEGSVEEQITSAIADVLGEDGDLSQLETTAKTIIGAVNELKSALDTAKTDLTISLTTKGTANTGASKTYIVKQGTTNIGEIDIPKDMVVSSGRVVKNPSGQPAGTYIELTLANATNDKLYIDVAGLVDVYTAAQNATQVQLAVNGYELSATIVAGGVGTTELANGAVTADKLATNAVTTAKITDKNVTKAKLAQAVQDSLDAADSALQKADIATGSANGTISVDGDDVAVKGLKSAAYTESTAYDAAGAANTAKTEVIGTASDAKTANTIHGAKAFATDAASTAEQNAKNYADGLASNYATAAQGTKADSALQKADITTGSTNGTITVKGTDVAVKGLGGAAYKAENYYDLAGAATTAETNAKAYVDTALTWGTIA